MPPRLAYYPLQLGQTWSPSCHHPTVVPPALQARDQRPQIRNAPTEASSSCYEQYAHAALAAHLQVGNLYLLDHSCIGVP